MKLFVSHIITGSEPIDLHHLKASLTHRWTEILLNELVNPKRKYALEWTLKGTGGLLEGRLDRELNSVVIECEDQGRLFEFVMWYRGYVNDAFELLMYDENYDFSIRLNKELTLEKFESLSASNSRAH